MLVDLIEELPGGGIDDVRGISERHLRRTNFVGAGIARMAMGVLDAALWDVLAQRAELPLFRLLGGGSSELRVYASGGWLTYSDGEFADEASALAELGYAGYKIKVGHADWRVDVGRVALVLEAVNGRMPVMVDANQAWTTKQALSAGLALAELGVDWFEESVPAEQLESHSRLAAALPLRVASGESVFTVEGFSSLVERRAADVVMPNIVRIGGPTRMIDVVSLARAAGVLVSPHLLAEVSGHVLAGLGGGCLLEHIPGWWDGLFEEPPPASSAGSYSSPRRAAWASASRTARSPSGPVTRRVLASAGAPD